MIKPHLDYQIAAGIQEAREHGHPAWSHAVAHGPCTKPSMFDEHDCNKNVEHRYDPSMSLGDYYVCGICDYLLQVG